MSATTHQRRGRGSSTIEFAPSGGEYQLTELKNVSTSRSSSANSADFNISLVQAVRDHPCFYDSNDSHYGTRHRDAQYRSDIWQQISNNIGFTGGAKALMEQWRKLKEKYTKERREGGSATEDPLDGELAAEMAWLDDYVDGIPAPSASTAPTADPRQIYYMEGEDVLMGDDFVDQHEEYQVESGLEDVRRGDGSPNGSAHSGTGSDIDVGGVSVLPRSSLPSSHPLKDLSGSSRGNGAIGSHGMISSGGIRTVTVQGARQPLSGGAHAPTYRFVNAASSSHQHHHGEGVPVSTRGNGTLIAYPKKEEDSVTDGGSTLTMVIDPTTYYQNGTQKMYRLVNVADLDRSQHPQHLRPAGTTMLAEPAGGIGIGRGTRKRMGGPLSPPMHSRGMMGGASSSVDHNSPYGKTTGQMGDDIILDDGIVGESTIVIDDQEDESSLLMESQGMHHHHLMMGGPTMQRGMHRGQHSPTLLGGSVARGYSPGLSIQGTSHQFSHTQYDADLALQHFISSHLARMNEDDKALAKMNIQRILLDARFGTGTTLRVCSCEEDAELTDAAIASEMVSGE